MQLIEWSVGLGGKRAPKTNEMLLQHLPEYDEVSQILPLAKIFPTLFPSANTLVAGKQKFIHQLDPISFGSPYRMVVPNFRFARQRER